MSRRHKIKEEEDQYITVRAPGVVKFVPTRAERNERTAPKADFSTRCVTTEERQRIEKWHAEARQHARGWHMVRDWSISKSGVFSIVYYVSFFKTKGEENDQSSMRVDTKADAQQIARVLNFRKAVPAWG